MFRTVGALVCALLLALAPQGPMRGAAAAEDARPALPADPPSAQAVDYARRYLVAVRITDTIRLVMDALGPALIEGEAAQRPGVTAADKQVIAEAVTESMVAVMPRFIDLYATELASILTEDELRQMVEFYEGPVGRSVTAKTRVMSQASERAMLKLLPEITEELEARICGRITCDGDRPARSRAS